MPQGVIFFRLIHLGAQLSLWALSTGTLLFIAHRNFKIYSTDLCVCLCMCVCVHVQTSVMECQDVSVLKCSTENNKTIGKCLAHKSI